MTQDGLMMKYVVLGPRSSDSGHRAASRKGILAYAEAMRETHPELASELEDWMAELEDQDAFPQ